MLPACGQFEDRKAAGQALASVLTKYRGQADVLVLALPRGGVPVAYEIAQALEAELDVLVVRKLGVPGYPELAMGAIASGGARVLNQDVVDLIGVSPEKIEAVVSRELVELQRRERSYRRNRPDPAIRGRTVILVDDGLATGASMRAAIAAARTLQPGKLVVAVSVAPSEKVQQFKQLADEVICVATPEPFNAVGQWYRHFGQTTDDEVRELLERARRATSAASSNAS